MRALALLVLLALVGCGGATCPADLVRDARPVLAAQRARSDALRSLKAEARIDQRSEKGRIKGRVLMFVERPERVRFDAMTQFGPALVLTSDGQELALSDFKDNRFYSGESCPSNIARIVGVALAGRDVVSVLLGDAPPLDAASESVRCSGEGSYVIERRGRDGTNQELEFQIHEDDFKKPAAQQRLTLVRVSFWNPQGKRLYRVRYEDYRDAGNGASLPFTVRIDDDTSGSDAVLRFSRIDTNVAVPPEAFRQTPRGGLAVDVLECTP